MRVDAIMRKGDVVKFVITPDTIQEAKQIKLVPGARPQEDRAEIYFPPELGTVRYLTDHFPFTITEHAERWVRATWAAHKATVQQGVLADVDLPAAVPWAELLRPYQRVGAKWLADVERGILGDDCGTGKSVVAATAVQLVGAQRVLVATRSYVRDQWARQIRKWIGPDEYIQVVDGNTPKKRAAQLANADARWMIINIEMLRVKENPGGKPLLKYPVLWTQQWDAVILDEAQYFRNRKAQQSRGAALLRSRYLFELTGTPVWNDVEDIWHLLHLARPKEFSAFWRFIEQYCDVQRTMYGMEIVGLKLDKMDDFHRMLAPKLLRRRKLDVAADLPPIITETIEYDLTATQAKAYKELKKKLQLTKSDGTIQTFANAVSMLPTARLLCAAPSLVGINGPSPKDDIILELLADKLPVSHNKCLIFTWFRNYTQYLVDMLEEHNYTAIGVTGEDKYREQSVRHFLTTDCQVLVATIGSLGTGMDELQAIKFAIMSQLDYVPTTVGQARDRIHRLGMSDESPLLYYIVGRNTIEAHMLQVYETKVDLTDEALAVQAVLQQFLAGE
jgi:SNF2 family DNA or RNA helicase